MSKKLNHAHRIYREMLDRYGEDDVHVRQMRAQVELLESMEFRHAGKLLPAALARTTGSHRRRLGESVHA